LTSSTAPAGVNRRTKPEENKSRPMHKRSSFLERMR
jgi:hypothetical protein